MGVSGTSSVFKMNVEGLLCHCQDAILVMPCRGARESEIWGWGAYRLRGGDEGECEEEGEK